MVQWEYKTCRVKGSGLLGNTVHPQDIDAVLNEAGSEGWELVGCVSLAETLGKSGELLYTFKRPQSS